MKKWSLYLALYFCICLLAACAAQPAPEEKPGPAPSEPTVTTCRVVTVENNQLLLAGADGNRNIYALSLEDTGGIQPGALVEVTYDGTILETWPAQFGGVSAVKTVEGGFDDRCALYLKVLEDLWEVDSGLNGGLTYIGVDLSQTSLSDSERAAVAWAFAGRHGGELVTGTWDELADQGYIDRENLYWEDGILFSACGLQGVNESFTPAMISNCFEGVGVAERCGHVLRAVVDFSVAVHMDAYVSAVERDVLCRCGNVGRWHCENPFGGCVPCGGFWFGDCGPSLFLSLRLKQ